MNWKSFEDILPNNADEILVCYYDFSISDFRYDVCCVEEENTYSLLQLPWSVENGDGELVVWCYIDEPKSRFKHTESIEQYITISDAKNLLRCSDSSIYHFVHYDDFPKMIKKDLKQYMFSLREFELWCKKHNYELTRWQYEQKR